MVEWLLTNYNLPPCHCQFFEYKSECIEGSFEKVLNKTVLKSAKKWYNYKDSLMCQPFFNEEKYTVVHYHIFCCKMTSIER